MPATTSSCSWPPAWTWLLLNFFLFLPKIPSSHVPPIVPTCRDKCGNLTIKYPFGSDFGCGHPDFARYIKCTSGELRFSSGTGIYSVSSIDYTTATLVLTDLFMSTCSSMQNSGSFRLDRGNPFTLSSQDTFILLGCSRTSPVFDPNEDLCDTGSGLHLCRGMYSCEGVTGIGLEPNAPVSSCCVYQPVIDFGSGYWLDLPKLQCSSYVSMYGFGGDETDPMKWQFGISLEYNNSYYTDTCKSCEASGGFCGFAGLTQSFSCICRGGGNSTTNCFGRGYAWSGTWRHKIQTKISFGGILLLWVVLLL
ncbi:uncharacterized protein LOC111879079 [Lactuca sativa]|uniref:non-specific serine/threonine protein kinase n=1 Tax=Lactuca sativa TaxID=4236 RepID=A0A9R1W9L1_LACSA|nr:uncharacterized protein LOC111879079 [Lactuca sativa]KAJ0218520.1 hypothetical protein LSAT_V11C300122830 [Lactuca sativa]